MGCGLIDTWDIATGSVDTSIDSLNVVGSTVEITHCGSAESLNVSVSGDANLRCGSIDALDITGSVDTGIDSLNVAGSTVEITHCGSAAQPVDSLNIAAGSLDANPHCSIDALDIASSLAE